MFRACLISLPYANSAPTSDCACPRIYRHRVYSFQIDNHSSITARISGQAMSAAANGQWQMVRSGEIQHLHNVVCIGAARDKDWTAIEGKVVCAPKFLVARALGGDQIAGKARLERRKIERRGGRSSARHGHYGSGQTQYGVASS